MNDLPKPPQDDAQPVYRIGAVSKLTGVPVTTLRVWESRYACFVPVKTAGLHRLYCQADVLKAGLLKQLTDAGHSIGSIAKLPHESLSRMLQQSRVGTLQAPQERLQANRVSMAVVGLAMASRIESQKFTLKFLSSSIQVTDVFFDLSDACAATLQETPHILLIKVNTLHDNVRSQIEQLVTQHGVLQTIVVYNYGQQAVVEALKLLGLIVRREPISDYELSDLISSVLLVDAARSMSPGPAGALIPSRKYSEKVLQRVATSSNNILCECPRHVAELIAQLASFEEYSQECLNKSADDAHLHAYLCSISGSARALFERALEMVAQHEGISLAENSVNPGSPDNPA
jgi:DNA-binding transcriptional MerR regulator